MEKTGAEGLFGHGDETNPDLQSFREEWRKELGEKSREGSEQNQDEHYDEDLHIKAREYFLQGVRLEESGKLYDAIKFYRKAINLVPDIEKEAFKYTGRLAGNNRGRSPASVPGEAEGSPAAETDPQQAEDQNLADKFVSSLNLENQTRIKPEFKTKSTHISDLPQEVLNYILKWVVSADLDLRSLESCSQVCRGFYLAARDNEIWRLICVRVWGPSVLTSTQFSWRQVYLDKPRLHFNGCYISKTTYIREGERGFQDHESYRAWHVVEYYRFIRLFPGGRMLMVISADDPGLTAKMMTKKNLSSMQGSLQGEYRIVDSVLVCVLHKFKPKKIIPKFRKKRRDSIVYNDVPDQDFLLEFGLKGSSGRTLVWHSYSIVNKFSNGREAVDSVSLSDSKFPRLQFSAVGSYHFESTAPLEIK